MLRIHNILTAALLAFLFAMPTTATCQNYCASFKSGNVDGSADEVVDISDLFGLIDYLNGNAPLPCINSQVPLVVTNGISEITQSTAMCGGNVTSDLGLTVTVRGVCWSTNATPTTSNDKTTDGEGTCSFVSSISGLSASTTYYVRAYATNGSGTGYGLAVPFTTPASSNTVTDIDGNVYPTVTIGTQVWMAANLKVTHYQNGDPLPNVTATATWTGLTAGAYCEYDNDVNNVATYGRLYNWYAASDVRNIAPAGWHVPTDAEWMQLEMYLGMSLAEVGGNQTWRGTTEGGKLKEAGLTHWATANIGATNESGFTALPGGTRYTGDYGVYVIGSWCAFWTSTDKPDYEITYGRVLSTDNAQVGRYFYYKHNGHSIRCVKD